MSTADGKQQPLHLRALIGWMLVLVTIGGFLGIFIRPPDAFPSLSFAHRDYPAWVGGAAALVTFILGMMFWASKACRASNAKAPLISQVIAGSLVISALNGFTFWMIAFNVEQWITRSTATVDAIYLTTAERWYEKGCVNSVRWYDPTVNNHIVFCTNLALFQRNDGRVNREAIAHVLRGPFGIRVVTIRALDTELGQDDLAAMKLGASKAQHPFPVSQ